MSEIKYFNIFTRSSSLYHPESEEEEETIGEHSENENDKVDEKREDSDVDRTYSVEEEGLDKVEDGKEVGQEQNYSSDNDSAEIEEELDD